MNIIYEACCIHICTKIIINNSRNESFILNGKSVFVIPTEIVSPTIDIIILPHCIYFILFLL